VRSTPEQSRITTRKRSTRGNCKKQFFTHGTPPKKTISLGNAGYRLGYRLCPCSNRTTSLCTAKEFAVFRKADSTVFEATGGRPSHPWPDSELPCFAAVLRGVIAGASMEPTGVKALLANRLANTHPLEDLLGWGWLHCLVDVLVSSSALDYAVLIKPMSYPLDPHDWRTLGLAGLLFALFGPALRLSRRAHSPALCGRGLWWLWSQAFAPWLLVNATMTTRFSGFGWVLVHFSALRQELTAIALSAVIHRVVHHHLGLVVGVYMGAMPPANCCFIARWRGDCRTWGCRRIGASTSACLSPDGDWVCAAPKGIGRRSLALRPARRGGDSAGPPRPPAFRAAEFETLRLGS